MDTSNFFDVSLDASDPAFPVYIAFLGQPLSREQAINLAAWLVALADPERRQFDEVFREITT